MSVTRINDKSLPGVKHNPEIWIAEGRSRFAVDWKNKALRWSQLLARLQTPTVTQETQAEYFAMKKDDQDNIKDVGGFVGGTLENGKRKSDTVQKRYLLTFDLDYAPPDFAETMQLEAPYAWAIYSTHKHTPDKPRMRLIAPLSRPVDPEEYEAIMRLLAKDIGLEYFDSTTAQPSRLMYWPSASRDAEYVFEYNDDKVLDADQLLGRYPDWRDVSYWPVWPDEIRVNKKRTDRQQDPTAKKGVVGTFCRTYTVPEAIERFLPGVYEALDGKGDRYTYLAGTTSGGMVIYDDGLFCYSHHSTDPARGQDLNAFDLVRIHKFGHEDEKTPDDTPASRRPSYASMQELVRSDPACIKTHDAERAQAAADEFNRDDESDAWMQKLQRLKSGEVAPTQINAVQILRNDPGLQLVRYNELGGFVEKTGPLPWETDPGAWSNDDDAMLRIHIARYFNEFKRADLADALITVAHERSFHPIKDYFARLPDWDGVQRADGLFIDYLGAPDEEYTREVAKRWLLAAVMRIRRPGVKFDYIPILSGPPGIGKSTLAARLGGAWFSDNLSFEDMRDKTAAEKLRGYWILEIPELKGMRKLEVEAVKSFASRQVDIYRPAYARRVEHYPRETVLIGTSNADDYLRDTTGNRRFWPVLCSGRTSRKPWELTAEDVAQIWAEVVTWIDTFGETQLTLSPKMEMVAQGRQMDVLEASESEEMIEVYLDTLLPENWYDMSVDDRRFWLMTSEKTGTMQRTEVTISEIWVECFRMPRGSRKRSDSDAIARSLQRLGWSQTGPTRVSGYGKQRVWTRN